jgi:hypothetical protein
MQLNKKDMYLLPLGSTSIPPNAHALRPLQAKSTNGGAEKSSKNANCNGSPLA